jgi:hypothetical protein
MRGCDRGCRANELVRRRADAVGEVEEAAADRGQSDPGLGIMSCSAKCRVARPHPQSQYGGRQRLTSSLRHPSGSKRLSLLQDLQFPTLTPD